MSFSAVLLLQLVSLLIKMLNVSGHTELYTLSLALSDHVDKLALNIVTLTNSVRVG